MPWPVASEGDWGVTGPDRQAADPDVGGFRASLRQMLRFTRPWERVLLGVVIFVGALLIRSYSLAALGVVIVGVTVLGVVRARRAGADVSGAETETESESEVGEP
jgi:hypothetical protein